MNEIERIADQLTRAVEGEAWHGPSLRETLDGLGATAAAVRPASGGHSAWEIALHIGAWLEEVRRRLDGEAVPLTDQEDWPAAADTSDAAWDGARASIHQACRALRDRVLALPVEALGRRVAGQRYSAGFMLDGVIQHTLYHAGQIALLKKPAPDPKRELLRHTLATLAYRGGKAVRGAPAGFAEFTAGEGSRPAGRILAHVGDLMDWGLSIVQGRQSWKDSEPLPWEEEVGRLFAALQRFDAYLASAEPLHAAPEQLFQGPIADALNHVGQIALLRRLAGAPVRGENYHRAEIVAGRVGPDQAPPRREFD